MQEVPDTAGRDRTSPVAPPLKGLANGLLEHLPDRPGHLAPQATQKTKATFSLGVRSWGWGQMQDAGGRPSGSRCGQGQQL